jgi:hypothetical protein
VIAESREWALQSSTSTTVGPIQAQSASPKPSPQQPAFFHHLVTTLLPRLYMFAPIIEDAELRANIAIMETDGDATFLVHAFAGIALVFEQYSKLWKANWSRPVLEMASCAISQLQPLSLDSKPPLSRLIGCVFLGMCLMGLDRLDMCAFYLRTAVSLMLLDGLDAFLDNAEDGSIERDRRERIYWLCFIHERHLGLDRSFPLTLEPLSSLPDVADLGSNAAIRGWHLIVQTWCLVDRDFVRFWTGDRSAVTAEWVQAKHRQLIDPVWEQEVATLSTAQQADLIITRQWLRTMNWQIAMSNVSLPSQADQSEALWTFMPLQLSSQIRACFERMWGQGLAADSVGLRDKLFDLTAVIADVVATMPPSDAAENTQSCIRDFLLMKHVLLGYPHVRPIHRQLLQEKMDHIRWLYRDTALSEMLETFDMDEDLN